MGKYAIFPMDPGLWVFNVLTSKCSYLPPECFVMSGGPTSSQRDAEVLVFTALELSSSWEKPSMKDVTD